MLEDYGDNPNTAPDNPVQVFFGRLVCELYSAYSGGKITNMKNSW